MAVTDTPLDQLIINVGTKAQVDQAIREGRITEDMLTVVTDQDIYVVQVTEMPVAGIDELGRNYQYVGATNQDYTYGYFYKCVANGTNPETYSWQQFNVQPETDISGKVDKTDEASQVYGTDENGDQTTYDLDSFGKVDDVKIGETSLVSNKIATIPTADTSTAGVSKLYTSTGQNTDGSMSQKAISDALSVIQESFFRGRWANWSNVPTNDSLYPEDYHGNHTPMENDYMVVEDTSDYTDDFPIDVSITTYGSGGWETFFTFTMDGETKSIQTGTVTFSNGVVVTVIGSSWGGRIIQINRNFKIGSTIYPKDTDYDLKGSVTSMKIASETPTIYSGVWRFAYHGVWATNGRDGWKPEYQVEDVLPVATDTVAGITKLYTTTGSNTDGTMDQNSITTALDAKQDLLDEFTAHEVEALWESIHA